MGPRKVSNPRLAILKGIASIGEDIAKLAPTLTDGERENFRKALTEQVAKLGSTVDELDPVLRPISLFNPLEPETTARIVALMAASQPRHRLSRRLKPFYGAGVYALYYRGPFEPYAGLSKKEHPLYVGKADPSNRSSNNPVAHGKALYDRLREHMNSIESTPTLQLEDFDCRFLIVQSGFQQAAEAQLISFFKPIWNRETKICYGIGKHGDAAATRRNKRSPWDTLHPGRSWADSSEENQRNREEIVHKIQKHLELYPPRDTLEELLDDFIEELQQIDASRFMDESGEPQDIESAQASVDNSADQISQEVLFDFSQVDGK